MRTKLGMIVILLLALMLTTYSGYLSAQPDISQSWKGSQHSRTWVVFNIPEKEDGFHIEFGDTFRIQGVRSHMQFVPLGALRTRWNRSENSGISLTREGAGGQKLCGKFNLDKHPDTPPKLHHILVEADLNDVNKIFISIKDNEEFGCAGATHGGRAHAEN